LHSLTTSWDQAYERELDNLEGCEDGDLDDLSEVWFSMDSVKRLLAWINSQPSINNETE
jgi:hypothetical protein